MDKDMHQSEENEDMNLNLTLFSWDWKKEQASKVIGITVTQKLRQTQLFAFYWSSFSFTSLKEPFACTSCTLQSAYCSHPHPLCYAEVFNQLIYSVVFKNPKVILLWHHSKEPFFLATSSFHVNNAVSQQLVRRMSVEIRLIAEGSFN